MTGNDSHCANHQTRVLLERPSNLFYHLVADGAGFTGSQVTVVAIGQVDAHFLSDKHLEAVHSLTGLGTPPGCCSLYQILSFDLLIVFRKVSHFPDWRATFLSVAIV